MTINYEKIKCPYCGKKFLATYGTSNYCPKCQAQTTIGEIGIPFKCKSCSHKFSSPKTIKCPKCGSRKSPKTIICPKCGSRKSPKTIGIKCPKCGSRKIRSRTQLVDVIDFFLA